MESIIKKIYLLSPIIVMIALMQMLIIFYPAYSKMGKSVSFLGVTTFAVIGFILLIIYYIGYFFVKSGTLKSVLDLIMIVAVICSGYYILLFAEGGIFDIFTKNYNYDIVKPSNEEYKNYIRLKSVLDDYSEKISSIDVNTDINAVINEKNYLNDAIYYAIARENQYRKNEIVSMILNKKFSNDYTVIMNEGILNSFINYQKVNLFIIRREILRDEIDNAVKELNELYRLINSIAGMEAMSFNDSYVAGYCMNEYISFINDNYRKLKKTNLEIYTDNNIEGKMKEIIKKGVAMEYNRSWYITTTALSKSINYAYPIVNMKKIKTQKYKSLKIILDRYKITHEGEKKQKQNIADYIFNPVGSLVFAVAEPDYKSLYPKYDELFENISLFERVRKLK